MNMNTTWYHVCFACNTGTFPDISNFYFTDEALAQEWADALIASREETPSQWAFPYTLEIWRLDFETRDHRNIRLEEGPSSVVNHQSAC